MLRGSWPLPTAVNPPIRTSDVSPLSWRHGLSTALVSPPTLLSLTVIISGWSLHRGRQCPSELSVDSSSSPLCPPYLLWTFLAPCGPWLRLGFRSSTRPPCGLYWRAAGWSLDQLAGTLWTGRLAPQLYPPLTDRHRWVYPNEMDVLGKMFFILFFYLSLDFFFLVC